MLLYNYKIVIIQHAINNQTKDGVIYRPLGGKGAVTKSGKLPRGAWHLCKVYDFACTAVHPGDTNNQPIIHWVLTYDPSGEN